MKNAFPHSYKGQQNCDSHITYIDHGMTLRDYFAGQAMVGIAALSDNPHCPDIRGQASLVYKLADAMIEAREKQSMNCTWTEDPDGIWYTSCEHAHEFNTGTPEENEHRYCPYCGKVLDISR